MKLFDKWDTTEIKVEDPALKKYIYLDGILLPRTGGKAAQGQRIWVQKTHIVERLMNKLMVSGHKGKKHKISSGHNTGKATIVYKAVKRCFEIIEEKTKKNPVEVFVKAIENGAPREEITAIEYGGARYSKAVEVSPQRRVDLALRYMVQGAYQKSFNSKKKIEQTLADEIIAASNTDQAHSNVIAKKLEAERQSDASR
ncbi:MAG: 30S ribosomal protein S7 [Nanoarchaeota archaeon]|nr:30S ribosomal protein S7 [Nanoarchaeota archaeon]MBU1444887.1 30S ribosomal protein S7 [Nanoarchaeota archaeon]MBU2406633.1 30S ribosomal protein S7 [Nanoarchaeota archaeon]MBU2420206.1 30S ribosomal protein S7 [Nanoarchaeota archaeon]MBU2475603.1 30S ribosomal protein S7 [Nanoarchaeota archaeon]